MQRRTEGEAHRGYKGMEPERDKGRERCNMSSDVGAAAGEGSGARNV